MRPPTTAVGLPSFAVSTCPATRLPLVYDAAALEARFREPDGVPILAERLRLATCTATTLAGGVASTYLSLLIGLAPPGRGPTALGDALATRAPDIREALESLGPTFVKFGQALGSRPDLIGPSLAAQLRGLQAEMRPFETDVARRIISEELGPAAAEPILRALPAYPIAAASIGQVYRVELPHPLPAGRSSAAPRWLVRGLNRRPPRVLAVKVMRPDARMAVAADAVLIRRAAAAVEALGGTGGGRLIQPALVRAVDEFFSRLFEEMDYVGEAANLRLFGEAYGPGGWGRRALGRGGEIVLPVPYEELSGGRVLSMSWVEGSPIGLEVAEVAASEEVLPAELARRLTIPPPRPRGPRADQLRLVEWGISCTLSQLLVTGLMHADTHGGNLLRVEPRQTRRLLPWRRQPPTLAYVDFGLVSRVPQNVRDGLICAVAQLLFARDTAKVAALFGELMLLPEAVLRDAPTRAKLEVALAVAADRLLVYEPGAALPEIRFDALVGEAARIAPAFAFELPPYFLNNARALASLEGLARSVDPNFSIVSSIYPFALITLLADKSGSPLLRRTLDDLATDPETGRLSLGRMRRLVAQLAELSRRSKARVYRDILGTRGGRRLARQWARQQMARGTGRAVQWVREHLALPAPSVA